MRAAVVRAGWIAIIPRPMNRSNTVDLPSLLEAADTFPRRHIGPDEQQVRAMLDVIGCTSLDQLIDQTIPTAIRLNRRLDITDGFGEHELLDDLRESAAKNKVMRSMIGMGYYDTITPPVIQRNIL